VDCCHRHSPICGVLARELLPRAEEVQLRLACAVVCVGHFHCGVVFFFGFGTGSPALRSRELEQTLRAGSRSVCGEASRRLHGAFVIFGGSPLAGGLAGLRPGLLGRTLSAADLARFLVSMFTTSVTAADRRFHRPRLQVLHAIRAALGGDSRTALAECRGVHAIAMVDTVPMREGQQYDRL